MRSNHFTMITPWTTALDRRVFMQHCKLWPMFSEVIRSQHALDIPYKYFSNFVVFKEFLSNSCYGWPRIDSSSAMVH